MHFNRGFFVYGLTLFVLTVFLSLFGLEWVPEHHLFSPVAPVAGVALAGLFLRGINFWPWIFLGALVSRAISYHDVSLAVVTLIAAINTTAYVTGAMYLRRRKIRRELSTLVDVRRFIVASGIVGAIAALAPLVLLVHCRFSGQEIPRGTPQDLIDVFFGRFTGVLLVGGFILTLEPVRVIRWFSKSFWKQVSALLATAVVTALVFGPLGTGIPYAWALFPLLVVCALYGGTSLSTKALLVIAAGALRGTSDDYGPFAMVSDTLGTLQQFLGVTSLTTLILSAVSTESREKRAIQQRSDDLQFLSDTAVELLSSAVLAESVQKILPALAVRCNVDIVTFHTASRDPTTVPQLVAQYGLDDTSPRQSSREELEACMSRALQQRAPLVPIEHRASYRSNEYEARSIKACFCVPVGEDGESLGALCVASSTRTEIDRGEAQLVETVGYYIRTAARRLSQEKKLRESEARFRELASAVPDIVWVSRADGTPEFYNKRWFEFTGDAESAEPRSRSIADLCDPTEREDVARQWSECVRTGKRFEMEHHLKHRTGSYRWVLTRAAPTHDSTGAIGRWFGTSTDLHDKKVLEAERDSLLQSERAARTEVERASRIKDDFLATLSHELRNPLNAILGWAHLLSRGGVDPQKAGGIIEQSARLQAQLIDDLLDMSRIVSGKLSLHRAVVNVSEVVSTTCESMQLVALSKGVSLEAQVESGVELAHADVSRITQIVANLLTNALKFTPRGGRVTVKVLKEGDDCVLTVCDTGEGMSADFLPHLFDRFRQADPSTTRRHGGLGIGLAITKHMTTLHGGSITATSPGLGQGSIFTVRLPLKFRADEASLRAAAKPTHPREEPSSRLVGTRIVVVEDDPPSLEFLSRFLSERGAVVAGYERGRTALDKVCVERPDMIISDIGMPDMDGYQLVKKIREASREDGHIPIIAVTAFARPEDEAKALQAGFDAHLAKPLDTDRLERVIIDLLDHSTPKAA